MPTANHMSKHSKWAKVKHQKGAVDAKRAGVFTKLARAVTVAAREGGGDPNFNFKLRTAIDQALAANMPKDNIERAIKRGTGGDEGERIEEVIYEGYGPGGAAIIAVALTDNRNRTSSSVRHIFSVHGGNMGSSGSVQWMFIRKGVMRCEGAGQPAETVEMSLIDAGAEDIAVEDGDLVVVTPPDALGAVKTAAEKTGLNADYVGFEWRPKKPVPAPEGEAKTKLEALLEALDDDEDVSEVFCNVEL